MIVSCKLKLDRRAVCGMLVNYNLSAWMLVAVNLNIVERKKWLREAICVFFMPEKGNSLALGSSWAILFDCRSCFLFGMVCIRDVCPGGGEQFYLLKEWITSRLSWHVPHLLPCWMAGPAPGCSQVLSFQGVLPCHFFLHMSCLAFFPMQSHFIPPLETTLQLSFVTVPPESLSLGKQMPRWGLAEQWCFLVVPSLLSGSSCCALDYRLLYLHSCFT